MAKSMKCINVKGREDYLTLSKIYEVELIMDCKYPHASLIADNGVRIGTDWERFKDIESK